MVELQIPGQCPHRSEGKGRTRVRTVKRLILQDNGGCAAQPPACCEAARRAEAAAKMVQAGTRRFS